MATTQQAPCAPGSCQVLEGGGECKVNRTYTEALSNPSCIHSQEPVISSGWPSAELSPVLH